MAGVGAGAGNGCHRAVEITLTRQLRLGICAGCHEGVPEQYRDGAAGTVPVK